MSSLRILITGVNGLIGSILREALERDHELFGLDHAGPFSERVLAADIAEYYQVDEAMRQFSPLDCIVHLAGNPNLTASWEEVLGSNIIGTRHVFEAARQHEVRRVIFASSNHVTGAYEGPPEDPVLHRQPGPPKISADDPIRPDSDYSLSKAFGETVARYYCARWGIQAICLRIGAVLKDDNPRRDPRDRRVWLSHRDLVQLMKKSLDANVMFGIYYGVSNNKGAFWDISNARLELGYEPVDDASELS